MLGRPKQRSGAFDDPHSTGLFSSSIRPAWRPTGIQSGLSEKRQPPGPWEGAEPRKRHCPVRHTSGYRNQQSKGAIEAGTLQAFFKFRAAIRGKTAAFPGKLQGENPRGRNFPKRVSARDYKVAKPAGQTPAFGRISTPVGGRPSAVDRTPVVP